MNLDNIILIIFSKVELARLKYYAIFAVTFLLASEGRVEEGTCGRSFLFIFFY